MSEHCILFLMLVVVQILVKFLPFLESQSIHDFVRLSAVQNKYVMWSNLVFSGKASEDWLKYSEQTTGSMNCL